MCGKDLMPHRMGSFYMNMPIQRELRGIFFRDFYNDHVVDIIKEIFFERLYDAYIKPGDIVVDVGANISLFTHWAVLHGAKTVYAIEPSSEHYDTLMNTILFNHWENTVVPINAALSNFTGEGEFYHNENTTMYSLKAVVGQSHLGTETVKVLDIENLVTTNNIDTIDLLKIDTEGSEFDILTSDQFRAVSKRVKKLIVEYHSWTGTSPAQLASLLWDLGYRVKQLQTQATVFVGEQT